MREALLGGVSNDLAGSAPCPVVVVPPGTSVPPRLESGVADSFRALEQLVAGGASHAFARLDALSDETDVARLPYTLRVLLENVLRAEALGHGSAEEVRAVAGWDARARPSREISFRPARVLLQDFTGVPAIVDLAAMRKAMVALGGDAAAINPQIPAELVIDHSVQVDEFGSRMAIFRNTEREFERNRERYAFLRWGRAPSTTSASSRRARGSSTR